MTMTTTNNISVSVPAEFICPLTKKIMMEPMMSRYGNHFERSTIMEWINQGHAYCPITHKSLRYSNLISDKNLEWKIQCWMKENISDVNETEEQPEEEQHNTDASSHSKVVVPATQSEEPFHANTLQGFISVTPSRFLCPLTKKLMKDPVMTRTGINYERKAILKQLTRDGDLCPVTKKQLKPSGVVANCKLQWEIQQWNLQYGQETCSDPSAKMCAASDYFKKSRSLARVPMKNILLSSTKAETVERTGLLSTPGNSKDLASVLDEVLATLQI